MAEQIMGASTGPRTHDCWWGELIYGTEQQLRRLGIGQGCPFPGAPGGHRKVMTVDPRGFAVEVRHHSGDTFVASIRYPDREKHPAERRETAEFAVGVTLVQNGYCDQYIGTGQALAAAGLVELRHLPGQPGMRKVAVTINPDGSVAGGAPTAVNPLARKPGARRISRKGRNKYLVSVVVCDEEQQRRRSAYKQIEADFMQRMWALPRPAPLSAPMTIGERFQRYVGAPTTRRVLPPTWRLFVNPNPPGA